MILIFIVLGFATHAASNFRVSKEICASWAIILFVALFFVKNIWLRLFLIWTLIRGIMGFNVHTTPTLFIMFLYIVFLQVLINNLKKEHLVQLMNGICILVLIQVTWMILQKSGVWIKIIPLDIKQADILKLLWGGRIVITRGNYNHTLTGLMSNINMSSSVLALGLPAFFRKKWYWGIPLVWVGLYLAGPMGGILPALIIMGIWVALEFRQHRAWIITLGICLFFLYILKTERLSLLLTGSGRTPVWKDIVQYVILFKEGGLVTNQWLLNFPQRMFFGWGVGMFKVIFPRAQQAFLSTWSNVVWMQAHNEYLQAWMEGGLIALGLLVGYFGSLIRKGFKYRTYISKIAFLAVFCGIMNCFVNFLLHTTAAGLFLAWIAILEKETEKGGVND